MPQKRLVLPFLATFVTVSLGLGELRAQTLTTLASFDNSNGGNPAGSLTLIGSTLYGQTADGGAYGQGTIFSLSPTSGDLTVLGALDGANGSGPLGNVTLSADGTTLYGLSFSGGANGAGAIYSVPVAGGTPTLLGSLNATTGDDPYGSLTLSADGSTLYGTASSGGAHNQGTIFSIPVTGGTPTGLTSFDGISAGGPYGGLTLIGSTLYGMASIGGYATSPGLPTDGVVFSVPVTGGPPTTLGEFHGTDGELPLGSLTLVGSTFYGMTHIRGPESGDYGTIFSLPVSGGTPTVLGSLNFTSGGGPWGDVTLVGSTLYGMAANAGQFGDGAIFSLPVTGGTPTVLVSFDGTNGAQPRGNLTLVGSTLYGMTSSGGAHGDGTIFALTLVPEPSSLILIGLGAVGFAFAALRRATRNRSA